MNIELKQIELTARKGIVKDLEAKVKEAEAEVDALENAPYEERQAAYENLADLAYELLKAIEKRDELQKFVTKWNTNSRRSIKRPTRR